MSKTIDATLLAHKQGTSTTLTDLLLLGPLSDNTYRGFTLLDRDVPFTPSLALGEIIFKARTGAELSAFQAGNDLSVNNAEANTLPPVAGFETEGITQQQIDSGALDKVRFVVLRVNYNDLTTGRSEVMQGGTIGEVRRKIGGLTVLELRSLTQLLKQMSLIQLSSIACRARFGSGAIGSGADVEEEFPCEYALSGEWVMGIITSVGTDVDRQFTDISLIGAGANYYAPGVVEILDGDNAGQQLEVDTFDTATGAVQLRFTTVSALANGVSYRIRRQCSKAWDGHNSCDTFWGVNKPLHYRGERSIPVGQAGSLLVPDPNIATS